MSKILSIVIPTYNMEKYLDRCLSSLVADEAHMSALEVLVINDGSKDRSSEIAHNYEARYPDTFTVVDKENGNYGSCVNKGLEIATGKYFRILDADDWFDTEGLCKLIDNLKDASSDAFFTKRSVHNGESVTGSHYPSFFSPSRSLSADEFAALEDKPYLSMHCLTFKTELLRRIGLKLQTGISYTDTEYCYYPLSIVNSMTFLDIVLYHYTADRPGQTMSHEKLVKSIGDMAKVIARMLDSAKQSLTHLQKIYLKDSLKTFFSIALTSCPKTPASDSAVKTVHERLKDVPGMTEYADSLMLDRIHYVRLWRKTGIFDTCPPLQVYHAIYSAVVTFLKRNKWTR